MSPLQPPGAALSAAAARNRDPIRDALGPHLPAAGTVLEIASGTGEHAVHNAAAFPGLTWRPSDADPEALASITAWRDHAGLANLTPPLRLDAADPDRWPVERTDAVVCINMIHISPWAATEGLMAGASRISPQGGLLYLYGPYLERGVQTAPGNLDFDASLKARNPAWGLRSLEEVCALAERHGLMFADRLEMPANNLSVFFRRA